MFPELVKGYVEEEGVSVVTRTTSVTQIGVTLQPLLVGCYDSPPPARENPVSARSACVHLTSRVTHLSRVKTRWGRVSREGVSRSWRQSSLRLYTTATAITVVGIDDNCGSLQCLVCVPTLEALGKVV